MIPFGGEEYHPRQPSIIRFNAFPGETRASAIVFAHLINRGMRLVRAPRAPTQPCSMRRISTLLPVTLLSVFLAVRAASADPIAPSNLIPETGPYGSFAVLFSPDAMPGVAEAAGADYLRVDGRRLGSLLAANTLPEYDAALVTAAFAEGEISARASRVMAGGVFDVATIWREDGSAVFAIGFTAFSEGGRMMIDGNAPHSLPADGDGLHVVAWAETEEAAALLIASSLELIARAEPLGFLQDAPIAGPIPTSPAVYPNPFAGSCTFKVALTATSSVDLAIFDALGRRVAMIASANLEAGVHRFALDANDLPAGVYVARLILDGRMSTRRITRMR